MFFHYFCACYVGKRSEKLYVGRIVEVNYGDNEVTTNFMRRMPSKKDFIIIFPEDNNEPWEHDADDIVMTLPPPVRVGGTARSSKQFRFPCALLHKFGTDIE